VKLGTWIRERTALGDQGPAMMPGGASFAYVFGAVLVFLLVVEAVSGAALAAFYSPSSTDAWASVAYIQDQAALGWLVRGIHSHGAGAIMVVSGLHLLQTAVAGAYKKPRELVWWLGILLLLLAVAWAVTGYVLRWDQAGYWANQVEVGIAAGAPLVGEKLRALAIGGNDYGNLTLTRFYTLHIVLMPALVTVVTVVHVKLARRHGTTPMRPRAPVPRWPHQAVRDAAAMALTLAIVLGWVVSQHGVELASPADPSQAYDARPLWYLRWLFELRVLAGSFEKLAAMAAPAILGGFLVALPLVDRTADRAPRTRMLWLGTLAGILALIGALTVASFARDANDDDLAKRHSHAALLAARARKLAIDNGVPVTGGIDVFHTPPMWQARTVFAARCAGCHDADSKDRKGPIIAPGHGDRAWLTAFLKAPSGDAFYGRTKLSKTDGAMKPVEISASDLADLVELLYAESGASDVDAAKRERGAKVFEGACTDCHSRDEGVAGASAPGLAGLGSRDHYTSFVGNPKSPVHMGADGSQMPRFDRELSLIERDAIAEYLVWLRTATKQDVDALGPP
jgi:ubiquinol-cytochrome c reductase cytochrome b subunit